MFTFAIPDTFDQSITFHNQNEPITGTVNAGIITGSPAMRDPSTDIVFVCNAMDVNSALEAWNGEVSDLRITYPPVGTFQLHVYGVIPDGQQYIFFCAPAGAPSLSPPVAGGGSGSGESGIYGGSGELTQDTTVTIGDNTLSFMRSGEVPGNEYYTGLHFNKTAMLPFQNMSGIIGIICRWMDSFTYLECRGEDGTITMGWANINEDVNRIQIASNGTFITSYQIFMQTWNDLFQIYMSNDEQSMIIKSTNVKIEITNLELSLIALINSNGIKIDDQRLVPYGITYANDYTATIKNNPRSLADVGTVNQLKKQPNVWTTAERPVPAGGEYPWGFNTTIGKHEGWNGTTWNSFY